MHISGASLKVNLPSTFKAAFASNKKINESKCGTINRSKCQVLLIIYRIFNNDFLKNTAMRIGNPNNGC